MTLFRGLLNRLARDLTTYRRQAAPSCWRMVTGEGRALTTGAGDLDGVDLDEVLGGRFRLAVQAVAEVNTSGVHDGPDRFDRIRHSYQEKVRDQQERTTR